MIEKIIYMAIGAALYHVAIKNETIKQGADALEDSIRERLPESDSLF